MFGAFYFGQPVFAEGLGSVAPVPPTPTPAVVPVSVPAVGGGGGGPRLHPFPTTHHDVRRQAVFVEQDVLVRVQCQVKAKVRTAHPATITATIALPSPICEAKIKVVRPTRIRVRDVILRSPHLHAFIRTAHPVVVTASFALSSVQQQGRMTSVGSERIVKRRRREEAVLMGLAEDEEGWA